MSTDTFGDCIPGFRITEHRASMGMGGSVNCTLGWHTEDTIWAHFVPRHVFPLDGLVEEAQRGSSR